MRVGMLALMRPVITSTMGRWVATTRWMPTARAIWARRVIGFFNVGAVEHHEVGQLVDDDDEEGKGLLFLAIVEEGRHRAFEELVVLVDVAYAAAGEELEAALHFADGVAQGVGCQLGLGDDGRKEMRNAFIHAEFHALRIDEDEPDLRRSRAIEQAHDHRIDGDGFA